MNWSRIDERTWKFTIDPRIRAIITRCSDGWRAEIETPTTTRSVCTMPRCATLENVQLATLAEIEREMAPALERVRAGMRELDGSTQELRGVVVGVDLLDVTLSHDGGLRHLAAETRVRERAAKLLGHHVIAEVRGRELIGIRGKREEVA